MVVEGGTRCSAATRSNRNNIVSSLSLSMLLWRCVDSTESFVSSSLFFFRPFISVLRVMRISRIASLSIWQYHHTAPSAHAAVMGRDKETTLFAWGVTHSF